MKKRKFNSLRLQKKYIANFKSASALGGKRKKNNPSLNLVCQTKICDSKAYLDCTVTHEACITQPRFCGLEI